MKTGSDQKIKTGPPIQLEEVTREYRMGKNTIKALDRISLAIPENEFCIMYGPSGSGKSTLLHLLGALDRATSGQIKVGSDDIEQFTDARRTRYRREQVGFVFQALNLLDNLSALENVLIPFIPEGGSRKMSGRAKDMLAEVGLENRVDHRPGRLSGGEKQRVAIARALLKNPGIVLADEPTGELDSTTGGRIFDLLRRVHREQKKTVIIVTHDTEYITAEDTTFHLKDGQQNGNHPPA